MKIYNAPANAAILDDLRYINYKRQASSKSLTAKTGFELKALPPTSDAAKYHSYRAYYQVQQWLGNSEISSEEWGWTQTDQGLVPKVKDKAEVPDNVLKMISCGCKQGCKGNCTCKQEGFFCTIMCTGCNGIACANCGRDENDV